MSNGFLSKKSRGKKINRQERKSYFLPFLNTRPIDRWIGWLVDRRKKKCSHFQVFVETSKNFRIKFSRLPGSLIFGLVELPSLWHRNHRSSIYTTTLLKPNNKLMTVPKRVTLETNKTRWLKIITTQFSSVGSENKKHIDCKQV